MRYAVGALPGAIIGNPAWLILPGPDRPRHGPPGAA